MEEYEEILSRVVNDPRYLKNIKFGEPRSGHPEGTVKVHIAELEANLERLKPRLRNDADYWKIKFLVHVHDTFKAEARRGAAISDPDSHASLARAFAAEFKTDEDMLNMIQYHDEGYALWRQYKSKDGAWLKRFEKLLETIRDWDLFLAFTVVDGCTPGKERDKLLWFIHEVRKFKETLVDEAWILAAE